jgi:hypothetical protein
MKKEKLPDRTPALGTNVFLDGNGASVKGFLEFCERNTPLVISVTLATLFVYGIILFNIVIAGDNPGRFDYDYWISDLISVNRWAAAILVKLFFIKESGIYASNFIAVLSI